MLKGVILGTSGTVPTRDRNCSGVYLNLGRESALLDCAEGTQRQLMKFDLSPMVDWIFISHYHLDHFLGLFGILSTMSLLDRKNKIDIYCPDTTKLKSLTTLLLKNLKFNLNFIEIIEDIEYIREDCKLSFVKTDHSVQSYAIIIKSLKNIKYKDKISTLPAEDIKAIVNNEWSKLTFNPEEFIQNRLCYYEVIYSGDTKYHQSLIDKITTGLVIHECSFFRKEELALARAKYHTHITQFKGLTTDNHLLFIHLPTKNSYDSMVSELKRIGLKGKIATDGLKFTLLRGDLKYQ